MRGGAGRPVPPGVGGSGRSRAGHRREPGRRKKKRRRRKRKRRRRRRRRGWGSQDGGGVAGAGGAAGGRPGSLLQRGPAAPGGLPGPQRVLLRVLGAAALPRQHPVVSGGPAGHPAPGGKALRAAVVPP